MRCINWRVREIIRDQQATDAFSQAANTQYSVVLRIGLQPKRFVYHVPLGAVLLDQLLDVFIFKEAFGSHHAKSFVLVFPSAHGPVMLGPALAFVFS
jgi:hypothetical protein